MDPDTAPAAQPTNDAPVVANPNDLETEMSAEEEQAFVNATLGIKEPDANPTPPEPTPPTGEEPKAPEAPKEPEATPPEPKEPEVPAPAVPKPEAPKEPEPTPELEAPQSDDLWIEVEKVVTDDEGKQTLQTVKLTYDPNNPGAFLPDDFAFKNDKQLMDIMEAKAEMAELYKERVNEFQTKTEEEQAKEATIKTEADTKAAWDAEIQDLITGGLLEAPKVTDPKDPKFMEDPTVAKVDAVFKFMAEQNKARATEDKPLLRSFGTAFNLYNKNSEAATEETRQKKANELAKARGSLVGGTSAASAGGEKPMYKVGSARSIYDVKIPE